MTHVMSMLAIAGLCSTGSVLAAQDVTAHRSPTAAKTVKIPSATYTGCVAEGSTKGTYALKDATAAGSTEKATYDLKGKGFAAHAGHKVAVTGKAYKTATLRNASLWPTTLKMVANRCS